MFCVVMSFSDDLFVDAEDYEVDEDGDLVFLNTDEEDEYESEDGMVEVGRVPAGKWDAVVAVEAEDDDEEVEVE